jgi:serpin B
VAALAGKIDRNAWFSWQSRAALSEGQGTVYLPRFKIESATDLNSQLESLGMKTAFKLGQANFTGMRPANDLFISLVRQAASLEVNEKGAEATAASEFAATKSADEEYQGPFEFVADRPFLIAITDESSGMILFWGVVREPA